MQTLSILLAAMSLDLGGAETHVVTLAKELAARGHRVHVASAPGRLVATLEEAGIPHHDLPLHSRAPHRMMQGIGMLGELLAVLNIDLIHAHARIPAFVAQWARAGRPLPLVTTYHGTYNASWPMRYVSRWGERVIAVSADVRDHLVHRLGAPADRIRIVPNGIDTAEFHPGVDPGPALAFQAAGAAVDAVMGGSEGPTGGPHIVHLGRQTDANAAAALALIGALPTLEPSNPGVTAWIVGDGSGLRRIEQAAAECNRRLGRQAAIVVGGQTDMPHWFAVADVVVGVARVALEAMACGKPVIVAGEGGYEGILTEDRIAGLREANFTARGSGRSIEPGSLAADAQTLLADQALRQRLGAVGRQFVLDELTITKVTDAVWGVYEEALASGRRGSVEAN